MKSKQKSSACIAIRFVAHHQIEHHCCLALLAALQRGVVEIPTQHQCDPNITLDAAMVQGGVGNLSRSTEWILCRIEMLQSGGWRLQAAAARGSDP